MKMKLLTIAIVLSGMVMSLPHPLHASDQRSNFPPLGDYVLACKYDAIGKNALAIGDIPGAKVAYEKAIAASALEEDANLGLARCFVADNDLAAAEPHYERVITENSVNVRRSINVLTEYVLVLQRENKISKAIKYFNDALHFSVSPNAIHPMETFPADFREDGSDYNANFMTSVVHIMRALNLDWNEQKQILYERQAAIDADSQNAIVQHYQGILLDLAKPQPTTPAATTGK